MNRILLRLSLLFGAVAIAASRLPADPPTAGDEFFEKQVRPLLVDRCVKCHGGEKVRGKLTLTSGPDLKRGGASGATVVPGKPNDSLLIKAVRYVDDDLRMPPDGKLSPSEIAVLARWVEMGAPWPGGSASATAVAKKFEITPAQRQFWSFQPLKKHPLPVVRGESWPQSPVDRFILASLEDRGLKPAPAADKRTLLRRVTFDLIGLPPTPQEIDAFLNDHAPGAFERVVERLLASPQYGERWARHWLDVVRYADSLDTRGLGGLGDISEAWRYRDWVVNAFNRDLPYDQFIMEQIAGDLLPPSPGGVNASGIIATTMLAIGSWESGEADKEKMMTDIVDDQIDVVSRGFMGLTVACARCHDHKFDPISTEDYYGLAGIFFSSHIVPDPGDRTGGALRLHIPLVPPADVDRYNLQKKQYALLEKQLKANVGGVAQIRTRASLDALKKNPLPPPPVAHGIREGGVPGSTLAGSACAGIRDARIHQRGSYKRLGETVPRHFPTILAGDKQAPIKQGSGRLELARWISRPDHPLTARVLVNRLWQYHFGDGIVRTPGNFGALGERPSHPELLDYLALVLIDSGWSIKAVHRAIVLSATYQQSSVPPEQTLKADPENRLFGRMHRKRLEAEAIRDSLLAVAGRLDVRLGGPATRDFNNPRRTLYQMTIRADRSTFRELFDAADSSAVVDKRTVSTVAPQALFLLNHPFVLQQAKSLAARLQKEAPGEAGARIDWLYEVLYARPATPQERSIGLQAVQQGWERYCHLLLCANEFIYVD